jgi:hypothetical protein
MASVIRTNLPPFFVSSSIPDSVVFVFKSRDKYRACVTFLAVPDILELQLLLPPLELLKKLVLPNTLGNNLTRPARIEGMQAQNTAAVVSIVDQKIVGTLFHVGSAVSPKFFSV